ncbi:MAG: homocysteine S-methyltransferase family protein [Ignavibacteriae bacterium]|nr:homocysteine S-methyltransferase family protein [Ignavibacteriota bacterium]
MNKLEIATVFNQLQKPLILDGAMGSLLQQRGFKSDKYLWMSYLNFKYPNIIKDIHKEYINAGCDIITTNTFRTNPSVFKKTITDFDQNKIVELSLNIAKDAVGDSNILIAGSNPPAEDSYQNERNITYKDLIDNHHQHIDLLYKYGADFILNETQSHFDEIEIVCKYCFENKVPYIISLLITDELKILSGENLSDVLDMINFYSPILICFNCIFSETFFKLLKSSFVIDNWGFYLNCGSSDYNDGNINCGISPIQYLEIVKSSLPFNPKLIGTCCGSNPHHTKIIRDFLDEKTNS